MNPSFTTKDGLIHVDPMTPEQFNQFINALNKVAHDIATEKSQADTAEFVRKLKRWNGMFGTMAKSSSSETCSKKP